jgi:hypothetical protein
MKHLAVAFLLTMAGCGYSIPKRQSISRMESVSIGQTRQEVIGAIGEPERMVFQRQDTQGTFRTDRHFLWKSWVPVYNLVACPFLLTVTCWMPIKGTSGEYYFLTYLNEKLVEIENREPQPPVLAPQIVQPVEPQKAYPQKSIYVQPTPEVIIQTNR